MRNFVNVEAKKAISTALKFLTQDMSVVKKTESDKNILHFLFHKFSYHYLFLPNTISLP